METTIVQKLDVMLASMLKLETSEERRKILEEMVKKPIITNVEFSILFSIHPRSCLRWRKKAGVPYIKIEGRIYYMWTSLLPLLEARQIIE